MASPDLNSPELFISRELSWLEFNDRVLRQGLARDVPLMERLKFLAIVTSNLDEFFMIRVAGLKQQLEAGVKKRDSSGLTPARQLARISERAHRMVADHGEAVDLALAELADKGLRLVDVLDLTPEQRVFLDSHFVSEILPALTPLAADELEPFPVIPGLGLNLAVALAGREGAEGQPRIAIVPVPGNLPRFLTVPAEDELRLIPLERLISSGLRHLFPDSSIEAVAAFRLTRDADVAIHEDEVADLLQAMEEAVRSRRRRAVVRLEVSAPPDPRLREWLMKWSEVDEQDLYEVPGLLDASSLWEIVRRPGFGDLRDPQWPPKPARDLVGSEDLWSVLQERDVLLFHPYESFEPVVDLLELAADDPNVLAVKQTLYRTSGESPVVAALARAAENGKQVVALVELKARFDESRNVNWARRLEDAGCHVVYGVSGFKTHAKLLLIIRREPHGIRRYVHASTGNYNDGTAKLYSDIGLMTTDRGFAADASAFFNLLTGYSREVGWLRLAMSPMGLRRRVLELIEREIAASTLDQPGLIMAKLNSLQDKAVVQALYRASQAGVEVRLNVRGICCLRPGIEGVSEGIEVVSIVDRYLEHARLFYFRNGGHEEVYLTSADLMGRNLDRRLEILFPVLDPALRQRLVGILQTCFADNVKALRLLADGTYERVERPGARVRAQEEFYSTAVEASQPAQGRHALQFRPLGGPREAAS